MKKFLLINILILFTCFGNSLKGGVPDTVYNLTEFPILESLITKSFKNIGKNITIYPLPNLRALSYGNTGELDFIFPYSESATNNYPNLIKVNVKIGGIHIKAYTLIDAPLIKSWNDIKTKKVAYILGTIFIEQKLKKYMNNPNNAIGAKDYTSLIKLLSSRRVDVVIADSYAFESVKTQNKQYNSWSLENSEVYILLNKKNKNILNSLELSIKKSIIAEKY